MRTTELVSCYCCCCWKNLQTNSQTDRQLAEKPKTEIHEFARWRTRKLWSKIMRAQQTKPNEQMKSRADWLAGWDFWLVLFLFCYCCCRYIDTDATLRPHVVFRERRRKLRVRE